MQVEIAVKVNGRIVQTHRAEVAGTLEQMEESIHALGKRIAGETLQASVDAMAVPRPLFREPAAGCGTKAIRREPSSDSTVS